MIRWLLAAGITAILFSCSGEEKKTSPIIHSEILSLPLKSIDGKIISVKDLTAGHPANVFLFLSPDCPMCQSYTLTIKKLQEKFSGKGISFTGIFPSEEYSDEDIRAFRSDFSTDYPFYRDTDFKLTRALRARVTPEVFVLDSTALILYSGSIDNWAYATGKKRLEATEFFLNDALENIVSGKPVAQKSTTAYGCLIE